MPIDNPDFGTENQSPYLVHSHREIVSLLRAIGGQHQLITMLVNGGADAVVTSILEVDDASNTVVIDCAPSALLNQRIIQSDDLAFEASLDKVRILFSVAKADTAIHENRPALRIPIPANLIRLQRREYYRVNTPVINPILCRIPLPADAGGGIYTTPLVDISCGGIAILDDKKVLDTTIGREYENCHIDLPGLGIVTVTLQIRNSQELTLFNGKTNRRLGCQFVDLSKAMLAAVQRYIMHLERERNAKITGLG
ncbi:flagellar brake protein [Sulfuriferula multivorans]|uniref:flagellar brake protein n=1 Tax=Sulfuriferula multivorans TaxID=1559896 RepID=UPI000F5C1D1E|nr:flagellar brake protein [Sulfuriferula multivorans]